MLNKGFSLNFLSSILWLVCIIIITIITTTVLSFQILVKITAAGVNPVDTYVRQGVFSRLPELPFTPGKDGAGIVHVVGENVTKFKVIYSFNIFPKKWQIKFQNSL